MKSIKLTLSTILVLILVLSLASTAFAADSYSITINNTSAGHTYEAYQIFTGDLSKAGEDASGSTQAVLSNVEWGSGVTYTGAGVTVNGAASTEAADIAAALNDGTLPLADFLDDLTLTTAIATSTNTGSAYVISGLAAGYYLVKDADASLTDAYDAYTSYIVEVVEDSVVTPKSVKPSVDKQVWDEETDAETGHENGWGESADHAINESFQFKLIATLPANSNYADYNTYKVVFNDTMSAGITFESIESVTVDGKTITDYTSTATEGQSGGSWKLTIADLKAIPGVNLIDGADVVVIYNAHLNEDAEIGNSDANKNTVFLQYSNNPLASGSGSGTPGDDDEDEELGKTPEDHVWVFTYTIENTKVDGTNNDQPLAGAGFRLYTDAECTQEFALIYDASISAYRPVSGSESGEEMFSAETSGIFNIVGLDAGTYYLKETTTPEGYNDVEDVITVVIDAVHAETESTDSASVTFTEDTQNTQNTIINKTGATLPETGGRGTKIFYMVGSLLILGSFVLLVTDRRMITGR